MLHMLTVLFSDALSYSKELDNGFLSTASGKRKFVSGETQEEGTQIEDIRSHGELASDIKMK